MPSYIHLKRSSKVVLIVVVKRLSRGFTLIEMVVCVAILALLATVVAPMGELMIKRNKEQDLRESLRVIRSALDAYKSAYDQGRMIKVVGASGYPPDLKALEDGVEDARSPTHKKIYFLRRVPRDPFSPPNLSAIDSWGLRSYESSRAEPKSGADVFDVYSQSDGVGINGVPYRDW
jgi:general secretion pathway protein G